MLVKVVSKCSEESACVTKGRLTKRVCRDSPHILELYLP